MRDKMRLTMNAIAENEYFARVTVAAFSAKMDPTMEELSDIKTAVSEAVTNAVVHGYDGKGGSVEIRAEIQDEWLEVEIEDEGIGMDGTGHGAFIHIASGNKSCRHGLYIYGGVYG